MSQIQNSEPEIRFGRGNAKLGDDVYTFQLPSGYSCPGAKQCLAKADMETGKITDGPHQKFRCFHASMEAIYTSLRIKGWDNFILLQKAAQEGGSRKMSEELLKALPPKAKKIRIHVGGDFFSQDYFDAWLHVAQSKPDILFYAYTTSIKFWTNRLDKIPKNLVLNASRGGQYDHLIDRFELPEVSVKFHPEENDLPVDHDDSLAMDPNVTNFSLLLHGVQPKGTEASKALKRLKDEKIKHSYGSRRSRIRKS